MANTKDVEALLRDVLVRQIPELQKTVEEALSRLLSPEKEN